MPSRVSAQQYGDWSNKLTDGTDDVTITTVGSKKALDVNLTSGDIQIGAVEIKDSSTDARAPVSATDGLLVNLGVNNDVSVSSSALPTGAATSAKQLADNHNVTVSNIASTPLITGFATSDKQLADNHNVVVTSVPTTTVTATNLDIRDLTSVSDSVEVKQATNANLKADVTSNAQNIATETTVATLATSANQTNGSQKTILVDDAGNTIDSATLTDGTTIHALQTHIADSKITGSMAVLNATVTATIGGFGSAVLNVSGTWTGKILIEGTVDGTTWTNLSVVQPAGGMTRNGIQNDHQNGNYRIVMVSGYTQMRTRMSEYTSGQVDVVLNFSQSPATTFAFQLEESNLNATVNATDLDIRDIDWATDDIKVYVADECQRILTSDDAVTTINYADSDKDEVSNIITSSATLSRKVTDTYDNSGATTLVITRAVSDV